MFSPAQTRGGEGRTDELPKEELDLQMAASPFLAVPWKHHMGSHVGFDVLVPKPFVSLLPWLSIGLVLLARGVCYEANFLPSL